MKHLHTRLAGALVALLSVCAVPHTLHAQISNKRFAVARYSGTNGSLDKTFDGDGMLVTDFGSNSNEEIRAVAPYPGGRVVAAGAHTLISGFEWPHFAVARYTDTGALDTTFATGGKALLTNVDGKAFAVVVQVDGKVVAGGYVWSLVTGGRFALVRLNVNGALDTTFGSGGIVITDFPSSTAEYVNALAIQTDGKIVAAGRGTSSTSGKLFALARYNTNGTLDPTFNGTGMVLTNLPLTTDEEALALTIQPSDSKIIAAGWGQRSTGAVYVLARYNTNGTLDTTFAAGGSSTMDIATTYDEAIPAVAVRNGKILAAGRGAVDVPGGCPADGGLCHPPTTDYYLTVARYNSDGSIDTTFGSSGKALRMFGTHTSSSGGPWLAAIAITADSKFVAVGGRPEGTFPFTGVGSTFELARYTSSVGLDTTFDVDGKLSTNFPSLGGEWSNAVAIDPTSGKIVAAGTGGAAPVIY